MTNYKFKKKPTIKEVANVAMELNNRLNSVIHFINELEKAFSLYVEMKGDDKEFGEFITKKIKEWKEQQNDAKANANTDKSNLQGDTDGESSGTEGIRKKTK